MVAAAAVWTATAGQSAISSLSCPATRSSRVSSSSVSSAEPTVDSTDATRIASASSVVTKAASSLVRIACWLAVHSHAPMTAAPTSVATAYPVAETGDSPWPSAISTSPRPTIRATPPVSRIRTPATSPAAAASSAIGCGASGTSSGSRRGSDSSVMRSGARPKARPASPIRASADHSVSLPTWAPLSA